MSSIKGAEAVEADKNILTVSIANSKFEVDSEYTKVSDFFTTWLEARVECHPEIVSENSNVSLDVLKGMTMPEVVIEKIVEYMNITKGIRQDILPHPLKEILPEEKGIRSDGAVFQGKTEQPSVAVQEPKATSMRAYLCKVRETPLQQSSEDDDEETAPSPEPEKPCEPYNFALADFIDEYVESNGMRGLYEMIGYSNYLGIKSLLYLCCGKVALMMKDKSIEEIKTLVDCFPKENGALEPKAPVTEGCDC